MVILCLFNKIRSGKWYFVNKESDDVKTANEVIARLKRERSKSSLLKSDRIKFYDCLGEKYEGGG